MENTAGNVLTATQEEVLGRWPDIEARMALKEAKDPKYWEDMLSECDLMFHEEKRNAVAHGRLHSEEILEIEHSFDNWGGIEKLQRFTILTYLLSLKNERTIDRAADPILHEIEDHRNELPPTTGD